MKRLVLCAALAFGFVATPVLAADGDIVQIRKIQLAQFPQLVAVLGQEMTDGGRFQYVTDAERETVRQLLAEMAETIAGRTALADLDEDEKVALLNAQERVDAILTRRDRDRLVCERRMLVGSHRRETVCETYGERREREAYSRDRANRLNKRIQRCVELTTPGFPANAGDAGIKCASG